MVFWILIGGLIAVRLFAKITEEWGKIIRVFISTIVACLIGLWALSLDVNSFENALNAVLIVPALLGVGASLIAVTLGWTTDHGVWSESFSIGNTSFGHSTGTMTLTAMIFIAITAASIIFFILWAFAGHIAIIIYFVLQGILLLIGLFREE